MAITTITGAERRYLVTTTTANVPGFPYLEVGPAGTTQQVSTMMMQFVPDVNFVGNFVVLGKMLGQVAKDRDVPFVAISYQRWSLDNVAQDYTMVQAPIAGSALIAIPANGLSIVLEIGLTAGQMEIFSWGLQGGSAVT